MLPSVAARLGADGFEDTLDLAADVGDARRFVVVLVDGLGYHLLAARPSTRRWLADVRAEHAATAALTVPVHDADQPRHARHRCGAGRARRRSASPSDVPGTDRVLTHIVWRDDPDPPAMAADSDGL